MSRNPMQKQKLLYLRKILLEKTDENHGLTSSEILAELALYGITAERKSLYDDISSLQMYGLDIEKIGPKFENHERFPQRINTEFARVIDRKTVEMRVWERGSGETLACGTGACAVAVASILNGYTEREVEIRLLGGNLQIEWNEEDNHVYMTGPATVVFDGEIEL